MTLLAPEPSAVGRAPRPARPRQYLMCRPDHFEVSYSINPWMDPTRPVDRAVALRQWEALRQTYVDLGHRVDVLGGEPGLPDMVFAANGGLVIGGRALGAKFAFAERAPEGPAYLRWLGRQVAGGRLRRAVPAQHVNEGEGDFLVTGGLVLAGTGFRTDVRAHAEVQELFGLPVVALRLVDPRYYHLDTALAVLSDGADANVAYYPGAFSDGSRQVLERLFPDAVIASAEDAAVLGLNAVSDGHHVVLSQAATGLMAQLRERGYEPVGVDLSELAKAGGSAKCCTLEIRP